MRVIVTRPPLQGAPWVDQLQRAGIDACCLPLIDIAPAADPAPLRAAWQAIAGYRLLMFVSANAVLHFMAQRPAAAPWPAQVLAGSTGPGTSAALRAAGVPTQSLVEPLGEPFDTETLWQRLCTGPWQGRRVLVLRGQDGRDWLATQLRKAGAQVDFVQTYVRVLPSLTSAQLETLAAAQRSPEAHLWLFSSSQALRNLRTLAAAADWSRSRAGATHPRIAEQAREIGFGDVVTVPVTPSELLPRLHALHSAGPRPPIQSGTS